MANPYFNAEYYLARNPDVFAAGINTPEAAWEHYVNFGAAEALNGATTRKPAPWFNISYYLAENPDLNTAGLTAGQLLDHFTNFGISEGRAPNADDNVDADTMSAYAVANPDLVEAFDIEDPTDLTDEEVVVLAQHFYAFGYKEDRPGLPYDPTNSDVDPIPGQVYTLTTGADVLDPNSAVPAFRTTNGDDLIRALNVDNTASNNTLNTVDAIDGGGGYDTMNVVLANDSGSDITVTPLIKNIEQINLSVTDDTKAVTLDLGDTTGLEKLVSKASAGAAQQNFTVSKITLGTELEIAGNHTGTTATFAFAGATGSSDSVDVTLNKATGNGTVVLDSIETVNLSSTGSANAVTLNGNKLATVTIDGDTATTLTIGAGAAGMNTLKVVDASEATGNFTLGLITTANNDISILGSAGNNVLNVAGTKKAEITTQDGNDSITVATTGAVTLDAAGGNDQIIISAAAKHVVTTGDGADVVFFSGNAGAATSTATNLTTIEDFTVGVDKLNLTNLGAQASVTSQANLTAIQVAIEALNADATLDDAVAAAVGITAQDDLAYFNFKGDTYVIVEQTNGGNAGDLVVKFTGAIDFVTSDFVL